MWRDFTYGLRGLLRSPALFIPAVVALALGIGLNAAMLGILDQLLLRPPAEVRDAGSLRRLYFMDPLSGEGQTEASYPMYADLAATAAFSRVGAFARTEASLGRGEAARKVEAGLATPSFFDLLGVQPVRGRLFSRLEGDPEAPGPVALLSWGFWQRDFGGAPEILGRALAIGRNHYTVIGILPAGFRGIDLAPVDLWLPIGAARALWAGPRWADDRGSFFLELVGRLRPGASSEQAAAQATAALRRDFGAMGGRGPHRVALVPVQEGHAPDHAQQVRLTAWLAGCSLAVLAIGGVNVAALLLGRGIGRRRELAVRLALGAGRADLLRLLLLESLTLAVLGGVAAGLVAPASGALIRRTLLLDAAPAARLFEPRLLAVLAVSAVAAGLLTAIAPLRLATRRDLAAALQEGSREGGPGPARLRGLLLIGQVALTAALLVGAGLLLRSLENVRRLHLGLAADRVLVVTIDLGGAGYTDAQVDEIFRRALDRVRRLPGVVRASVAAAIPFRSSFGAQLALPGRGYVSGLAPGHAYLNAVMGDFFATLGTAVRRGRALTDADESGRERVVVVNETAARLLWPGQDSLGRCVEVGSEKEPCATIVGVVEDARRSALLPEPPTIQVYVPLMQAPSWVRSRALFVRPARDLEFLAKEIRREVQAVAPNLPYVDVTKLSERLDPQARRWTTGAALLALFGVLALVLATIGIFAAVSSEVASRRHELGVRLALGARPHDAFWLVTKLGVGPAALGAGLGLGLALAASRSVEPLLFAVRVGDPWTAAGVVLVLLIAALLASCAPALRARRIDPATELRAE